MANHGGLFLAISVWRLASLGKADASASHDTPCHRMIRTEEDDAYFDYVIGKAERWRRLMRQLMKSSRENGHRQRTAVAGACSRPISASAFVIERDPKLPVAVEVIRYGRAARSERIPV